MPQLGQQCPAAHPGAVLPLGISLPCLAQFMCCQEFLWHWSCPVSFPCLCANKAGESGNVENVPALLRSKEGLVAPPQLSAPTNKSLTWLSHSGFSNANKPGFGIHKGKSYCHRGYKHNPLSHDLIPLVFSWCILCQHSLGVLGWMVRFVCVTF